MSSTEPQDITILREKIRLKKLDRQVYAREVESLIKKNHNRQRALCIGNICLRNMTKQQNDMPITINAAILDTLKDPKLRSNHAKQQTLKESIKANDAVLFKAGKRLLKQDYIRDRQEDKLVETKDKLQRTNRQRENRIMDYDLECTKFLHRQAMVEDSNNREVAARVIHQRLVKILDELNRDIETYPLRLQEKEKQIADKSKEQKDFELLNERAQRFLGEETDRMEPMDKELHKVTVYFEKLISLAKNDMEDRRKRGDLAKFLAERETNPLSFTESSNLNDLKRRNRNRSLVKSYEIIIALMDSVMVCDIENVVDCFLDQQDVHESLNTERQVRQRFNTSLKTQLSELKTNNEFLSYDYVKNAKSRDQFQAVVAEETKVTRSLVEKEKVLHDQDYLLSCLNLTVHSLMEKLRPIKLEEPNNRIHGELVLDTQNVITKAAKMISIIDKNVIPIGRVRPIVLYTFKQKRIPPDAVRGELTAQGSAPSMSMETFESDQPGLVTREMLKTRAVESGANKKNKDAKAKK